MSLFGGTPADAIASGRVGAMLQTGGLLRDLTVRELVSMMAALYPRPLGVDEVLELTGLQDTAAQRTEKLSGGQAQRVRFACALVSNPDLLVLDEPTVAMDVEGRHAFWATMREFASRGTTIVFATHYLEEADAFADRAVLMAHGRVVADGPTTEIKARVGSRTIRATLPGVRGRGAAGARGRRDGRAPRCGDHAALHRLRRGDPRAAGRPSRRPATGDQRRRAGGGVPRADRRRGRRRSSETVAA